MPSDKNVVDVPTYSLMRACLVLCFFLRADFARDASDRTHPPSMGARTSQGPFFT